MPTTSQTTEAKQYRSRIYDRYASTTHTNAGTFSDSSANKWSQARLWYFRGWLPEDHSSPILDLGCGNGLWLWHLKSQGYTNLVGVDISPEQVEKARLTGIAIQQVDSTQYLLANPRRFGLITGLDIIEHLTKDEVLPLLDACFAALRPGGRLILQTPNADSPYASHLRYSDFTHEWSFAPESLAKLLRMSGFVEVTAREIDPVRNGYSLSSTCRYWLWQWYRLKTMIFNVIETGSPGSRIISRVFITLACKP